MRKNNDPKQYFLDHYGQDRITTGELQDADPLLYRTLYRALEKEGKTVVEFVEPGGKPYAKRALACAQILGTESVLEAGKFFGGIRADRISKHHGKIAKGF